jgi:hypothetical protein
MVKGPLKTRRSRVFTQSGPLADPGPKATSTLPHGNRVQLGSAMTALCSAVEHLCTDA